MSAPADILRRLAALDPDTSTGGIYFVDCDETDPARLPDGPAVRADIDAIRAKDPAAHIIKFVYVDPGRIAAERAAVEVAP
jgi:hypothetical protein